MKKISLGLIVVAIVYLAYLGAFEMNKIEDIPEISEVYTPIGPIVDKVILHQEDINTWIEEYDDYIPTDLAVSFDTNDQVELSFILDDKVTQMLPVDQQAQMKDILGLFNGQKVSCVVELEQNVQIHAESCKVGFVTIPSEIYQEKLDDLNKQLTILVKSVGIEELSITNQQIEILGDISKIIDTFMK